MVKTAGKQEVTLKFAPIKRTRESGGTPPSTSQPHKKIDDSKSKAIPPAPKKQSSGIAQTAQIIEHQASSLPMTDTSAGSHPGPADKPIIAATPSILKNVSSIVAAFEGVRKSPDGPKSSAQPDSVVQKRTIDGKDGNQ